jgi:hypothetical protein
MNANTEVTVSQVYLDTAVEQQSSKAAEDWPHSKTCREFACSSYSRSVLECGQSPAALLQDCVAILTPTAKLEPRYLVSYNYTR